MVILSVEITDVASKDTLLQNLNPVYDTNFMDQFFSLEYRGFNHFDSLVPCDPDEMQFDLVRRMRRGSIRSLPVNRTEVIV